MKNHFMVDIETMGTLPYSIIMSIGIVAFDIITGELGEEFYKTIDVKSSKSFNLIQDKATVEWWNKQDSCIFLELFKNTEQLPTVLKELNSFLKNNCKTDKLMWGNSASFDLGLLRNAYERCGIIPQWYYGNEFCCRTIVLLNPSVKNNMSKLVGAHHPITDCKNQIEYLVKTINSIYGKEAKK